MGDAIWFYVHESQQVGPVPLAAIQSAISQKQIAPTALVWREGMANWMPARSVAEVMPEGFSPTGGPPALPTPVVPLEYFPPPPMGEDIGQNAGVRMLLPVGRSGWAIAAGYLGLFSILVIPAPFAIIIAIVAIRDIRRHPDRHGMGRAIFGLVMGCLMILVVIAIIFN